MSGDVFGQHLYQEPKDPLPVSYIQEIIGPISEESLEDGLNLLWVYGYDEHHIPGAHDYELVKDTMVQLLGAIEKVIIDEAFEFPSQDQFNSADVIIFFVHFPSLRKRQFNDLRNFILNGGGVVSLHETAILRPPSKGKKLSECLGMAWNDDGSKWGAIFDEIKLDTSHPILEGFFEKLVISDEFYWDLFEEQSVRILGEVRTGPDGDSERSVPVDQLSKDYSPIIWTYEIGKGKVFGTTIGHNTYSYFDPEFRIILFRSIAYVGNISFEPFKKLVYHGITSKEGMVGINTDLRYWEGKRRSIKELD